ncbi:MAG: hypothetical protein AAF596_09560 [Planctomycetota bacterium]
MKKLTLLMAIVLLTSQLVGCGLFRRVRDTLCKGAYCGASTVSAPGFVAPATVVAPQAPIIVPQASVGCDPCVTCSPVCDPCCDPCMTGGLAYPMATGYSGCNDCNGGVVYDGGVTLPQSQVFPGPAN